MSGGVCHIKRGCQRGAPGNALIHTFAVPMNQWDRPVRVLACIVPVDAAAVAAPPAVRTCRAGTQSHNVQRHHMLMLQLQKLCSIITEPLIR